MDDSEHVSEVGIGYRRMNLQTSRGRVNHDIMSQCVAASKMNVLSFVSPQQQVLMHAMERH